MQYRLNINHLKTAQPPQNNESADIRHTPLGSPQAIHTMKEVCAYGHTTQCMYLLSSFFSRGGDSEAIELIIKKLLGYT